MTAWNSDLSLDEPMPMLPNYKQQRRRSATPTKSLQSFQMIGADTETIDGCADLFSYEAIKRTGTGKDATYEFIPKVKRVESMLDVMIIGIEVGHRWKCGGKKGWTIPQMFFWNIKYDMQAVMKFMSKRAINELTTQSSVTINARTGDLLPKGKGQPMVEITHLEKKHARFEPIGWNMDCGRLTFGEEKGHSVGMMQWWDISQFYGKLRLDTAAKKFLNEGKTEMCSDGSKLDASRFSEMLPITGERFPYDESDFEWVRYYDYYQADIQKYAKQDASLTGKLARAKRSDFVGSAVRFIQPYSPANVSQRNLLDRGYFPTMNAMMGDEHGKEVTQAFLSAYHGGLFDAAETGFIPDATIVDLVSAYPYIMYNLPAISHLAEVPKFHKKTGKPIKSGWTEELLGEFTYGEGIDGWNAAIDGKPYGWIGAVEVSITFKPDQRWHPLATKAANGTLVSPQYFNGWVDLESYREAVKWEYDELIVGRWSMYENDNPTYPFRPFIEYWYGVKNAATKGSVEYEIAKLMQNSVYGKTIQCIDEKTGALWNPMYAATITGATRARLMELTRLNDQSPVMVATDGVVIETSKLHTIPKRPAPAIGNLGEWETEVSGDTLIMGSGVYTVITGDKASNKPNGYLPKMIPIGKTTYRGNASMNIRGYESWIDFCLANADETEVVTHFLRPVSAGEARTQKQKNGGYECINIFEEKKATIRPMMDSSKRIWMGEAPETFGDLLNNRYTLTPHITVGNILSNEEMEVGYDEV